MLCLIRQSTNDGAGRVSKTKGRFEDNNMMNSEEGDRETGSRAGGAAGAEIGGGDVDANAISGVEPPSKSMSWKSDRWPDDGWLDEASELSEFPVDGGVRSIGLPASRASG